jgi:hypothetical protein
MDLLPRRLPLVLLLLTVGCRPLPTDDPPACGTVPVDPLAAVIVQNAHLEDLAFWQAGVIVGGFDGDGLLVVNDGIENEPVHVFEVVFQGTMFGVTAEWSWMLAPGKVDLRAPTNTTARGLIGTYTSLHTGGTVGAGGHLRTIGNDIGVEAVLGTVSFGLGVTPAAWEKIQLRLVDDPIQFMQPGFEDNLDDDDDFDDFDDIDDFEDGEDGEDG